MPEVMMGVIPSSMSVPLQTFPSIQVYADMTRFDYQLSLPSSLLPANTAPAHLRPSLQDAQTQRRKGKTHRLEARMTLIQYKGSLESEDMIPYSGTCEQTRKMARVTAVQRHFWSNGTCDLTSETIQLGYAIVLW